MNREPVRRSDGPPESADGRIDTIGLYCPVPIIRTAARMKGMKTGETLEVISSDRVILADLPAWCRSTGNQYLGSRQTGEREWRLFVRKAGAAAVPAEEGR